MYLVIQKGYVTFGKGDTAEQAWQDAKEWIDSDDEKQEWDVAQLPSLQQAADGELCIVSIDDMDADEIELYA